MEQGSKNRKNQTAEKVSTLSKGEQIIGTFNPSGNKDVETIKLSAIELINNIEKLGLDPRRKAAAITQIELGVMMGVKSLFP